jgi:hypothetical protein
MQALSAILHLRNGIPKKLHIFLAASFAQECISQPPSPSQVKINIPLLMNP